MILLLVPHHCKAQYIPEDFFHDDHKTEIGFWPNDGQVIATDGQLATTVKFVSDGCSPQMYLHDKSRVSFVIRNLDASQQDTLHRLDMKPVGTNAIDSDPVSVVLKNVIHRYYYPHCPDGIEVHGYNRIIYEDVYPRIDFHYYGASSGQKFTIVCRPGSDPNNIKLEFTGQDSLSLDVYGFLKLHFLTDSVSLPYALAYQIDNSGNPVALGWIATYTAGEQAGVVGFNFSTYDTTKPLMLQFGGLPAGGGGAEPSLDWSTLMGSEHGAGASEFISAGDADSEGNLYVAGSTRDQAFPLNTGTTPHAGNTDIVYGRFNYAPEDPDQDARVDYMAFYGGTGDDKATVLYNQRNTENGVVYVGGWSNSSDFPSVPNTNPLDGTYFQSTRKGSSDGVILRLNTSDGTPLRGTYYGGDGDEMITAVTEDAAGNIYFAGATNSQTGTYGANCSSPTTGFPLCSTEDADYAQSANAGGTDGFVLRLGPDFRLTWSTFYGGTGEDHIYDAAYMNGPSTPAGLGDRVALVGSSTGSVPFGETGLFQITSNTSENGFIATFDSDCRPHWGTFVQGLIRLEAVIADKTSLLVMGVTDNQATTSLTCDEVQNGIPICDPGGGAYQDATVHTRDAFFAEFLQPSGALKWSSVYGDLGWMGAEFPDEGTAPDKYQMEQAQPFPIYRFSDLEADPSSSIYAMGLFDNKKWNETDDFQSTLFGYGLHNQPYNAATGSYQTDLDLLLFDEGRRLQWASLFGGGFDHVGFDFDFQWVLKGSDFGHDLVLVPGKALYWVGTAGGVALPEACPYPNVSWCETSLVGVGDNLDPMQGFATRMNLRDISIGINDTSAMEGSVLYCLPNPTNGSISFRSKWHQLSKASISITNTLGQTVLTAVLDDQGSVDVTSLSGGSYAARIIPLHEHSSHVVRFIRQ